MFECALILWWGDVTRKRLNGANRRCGEVGFVQRMINGVTMIYLCRRKVRRDDGPSLRVMGRTASAVTCELGFIHMVWTEPGQIKAREENITQQVSWLVRRTS